MRQQGPLRSVFTTISTPAPAISSREGTRRTSDDPVREARGEVPRALAPVRVAEDEHPRVRREAPRCPALGAREDRPKRVYRLPRVLRAGPVPVESLRFPREVSAVHRRVFGGRELTQDVRPAGITTQLRFCRGIASAQKECARTSTPAPSAPRACVSVLRLCVREDGNGNRTGKATHGGRGSAGGAARPSASAPRAKAR